MKDSGLSFSRLGTNQGTPMPVAMPSLSVAERSGSVCLQLGGLARGQGMTLQEAADDLIRRLLALAIAFRSNGFMVSRELPPDRDALDFLCKLGEVAASGDDVRAYVFG
jgi:hypothetical protein